ncbi:MAG: leucine-rich repeat domain-containing protein [Muribaculaceae bacterium]|nr:leucine-rich repeat domain-containing protein [Muribaculaceae bacterium]
MKTFKQNILILLTLLAILPNSLHAQEAKEPKTFTYEYEGQTLTYEVIDESAKTCRTNPGEYGKNPGNTVNDELKLPAKPIDDETEYTLVEISEYSFWNCASLSSIEIPESVTTIEEGAFDSCIGLKNIIIPTPVTNIGIYAFNGCSSLNYISFPSTLTTIGGVAFSNCTSLSNIIIPEAVTSIGEDAFSGCPAVVTYNAKNCAISFPQNTAENQKASPFADITSLTIGNTVETIPDYAFKNCTNLVSINMESATSLTTIGNEANPYLR